MTITIRRAQPTDSQAAQSIARANFTETFGDSYSESDLAHYLATAYDLSVFEHQLRSPDYALFLLEANGTAIGHGLCGPNTLPHVDARPGHLELKRMYVLKDFHNQGLGARLMDAAMHWLATQKPETVWIGVWSENFGAQRFYERYGFAKAGEYEFIVGETRDHEFILRRDYRAP